jgi:PEP-CTERM motif
LRGASQFLEPVALAGTIAGPALTSPDGGYDYSGLSFTADVNATLTGFTFMNQGLADTVVLENSAGTVLDSIAIPSSTPTDVVSGLTWSLSSGTLYYLLQTTSENGYYADWGMTAPSDAQISLVDTGDWSFTSPIPSNFYIGGTDPTYPGTEWWGDFNNITTTAAVSGVPEPYSMALLLAGAAAMALAGRRRGRSANLRP